MPDSPRVLLIGDAGSPARASLEQDGGFHLETVASTRAALDLLLAKTVDAIVCDPGLPAAEVFAFLERARSLPGDIPVILFAGRGDDVRIGKARAGGAVICPHGGGGPGAKADGLPQIIRDTVRAGHDDTEMTEATSGIRKRLEEERLVSEFSQFLLNATTVEQVLDHFGDMVFDRSGADYLMLAKLYTQENAIGIHSLRGFGQLLDEIGRLVHTSPEQLKVPDRLILEKTPEVPLRTGLRKLDGGIFTLSRGYLPQPVCTAIERLIQVETICIYELVWEGNLYGSVTFGFRKGNRINNPSFINTLCNLLANGLWRISSARAIIAERQSLAESEAKFRSIFENSPFPIAINSMPDGKFIAVNAAFLQSSGYSREDVMGKNPVELGLLPPSAYALLGSHLLLHGRIESLPLALSGRDGRLVHVQYTTVPITIDHRPAIMSVTAEITRMKRIEAELLQKNKALEEANRKLNLLSGITRHDIRNQLTVLAGFLDVSLRTLDDPVRMADYVIREKRITGIIAQQIDFTRDYENIGIKAPVWQNVAGLVRRIIPSLQLPPRNIRIDEGDPALEIYADPLFEKVFFNLIDNALRYGGERMTAIRVIERMAEGDLVLVVEDDGEGIPADARPHLFERGFGKNTGLGLFLSREILSITGITITETGEQGRGARFQMTVPEGQYRFGKNE